MGYNESEIRFTKMQGAGNDYVYVDATDFSPRLIESLSHLAPSISDRHFGIGGDGLVLVLRSEVADFRMRMFNSDGSEAQMCGNASRCVGKLVYDTGLTEKKIISLETLAGIKILHLNVGEDDKVRSVRVDMGQPELRASMIPVRPGYFKQNGDAVLVGMEHSGINFEAVAVSMGNPHAVIFIDETPTDNHVLTIGKAFEHHPAWPEKVNVEFVRIIDRETVEMRVWERGSGETLACGTGSCATVVAGILLGLLESKVKVKLLGGTLEIEWSSTDGHVYMTGPAKIVATGIYFPESAPDWDSKDRMSTDTVHDESPDNELNKKKNESVT